MGIGNVEITGYSQISEEIARIIFIVIFVYIFRDKGDAYLAYGALLLVGCLATAFAAIETAIVVKFYFDIRLYKFLTRL